MSAKRGHQKIYVVFQRDPDSHEEPLIAVLGSKGEAEKLEVEQNRRRPGYRTAWEEITMACSQPVGADQVIYLVMSGQADRVRRGLPDMDPEVEGAFLSEESAQAAMNEKTRAISGSASHYQATSAASYADNEFPWPPVPHEHFYIRSVQLGWRDPDL